MAPQSTSSKKSTVINAILSILVSIIVVSSLARYITEPQDNERCHGMLNDGQWMSSSYDRWKPSGCMAKTYKGDDISQCLNNTHVVYIGDSIMREQFYSLTAYMTKLRTRDAVHGDQTYHIKENGMTIEMWWDPYLNTSRTIDLLEGRAKNKPSLLVMGSGIWYMRRTGANYLTEWKSAIDRIFDGAKKTSIADRIMMSPVEIVYYDLMIPERKETLTIDKITIMNNYLRERETNIRNPVTPIVVPFVWNEIVVTTTNQTEDGLHFKPPVTKAQAQLALNYRCNQQLEKSFPMVNTCCNTYPHPKWYQSAIFIFFLCTIPLGFLAIQSTSECLSKVADYIYPSSTNSLFAIFIFGLSVVYMYVGDRTQLFGKMYKQFDPVTFSILSLVTVAAGLLTVKTINKDPESEPGFLNRNQTDEWKGWMQVMILVYHFTGASGTSGIYNPIRVLVAAYLFQTGYGHFYFFYKKADYGIARILNVMVRLNLLTCVLAYTMDTNYLFYYFSPLVSFWFAAIWVAMFVGYKYNNHGWFILSKIIIMGVITGFIIHYPGILEFIFDFLTWAFKIQWNVTEWRFRLSLDAWIVYVGMICAYISIKISEYKLPAEYPFMWKITKYVSAVLSILGMIGFFWFELSMSKASYNGYQPYISWIPILSFVCLRNCTRLFRNTYSRFFAFIGKISLETFIGQFHMWLAADTTGLLVIIPNASWVIKTEIGWWVNLGVSSLIFVFVCYHLSEATGVITRLLCSGAKEQKSKENYSSLPNPAEATTQDTVPLLPTNSSSGNGNKNEEEEGPDRFNVETEEDESVYLEENVHTNRKVKWYKPIIESISQNYWLRTISFLVGAGIVNRFCS